MRKKTIKAGHTSRDGCPWFLRVVEIMKMGRKDGAKLMFAHLHEQRGVMWTML